MKKIYLDSAAATPVYKKVAKIMEKFYFDKYGNPSSVHEMGEEARKAIDDARKKLAGEIGAKPWELIFTSGATESNNLALIGIARANKKKEKNKIVISSIEHASVWEAAEALKREGFEVVKVGVNNEGFVDLIELDNIIDENTILVSIIHGNNEIGTVQNLKKIGDICKRKRVIFHSDVVQSFARERIAVKEMGVDLLSVSGHKFGAPKGVGFLYLREGTKIEPIIYGGGQEKGLRGGTENVPGIVGMVKALEIAKKIDKKKIDKIRKYFMNELEKIGGRINGSRDKRVGGNVHVSFPGVNADRAVLELSRRGIMCSTGSACESSSKNEKRVLIAIGLTDEEIKGSIRFSLNDKITKKDISYVIGELKKLLLLPKRDFYLDS